MEGTIVKEGAKLYKAIVAENTVIGKNCEIGVGEYRENEVDKRVYASDLVVIGEKTTIPDGIKIGKNTAVWGETTYQDYNNGMLQSGGYLVKAGEEKSYQDQRETKPLKQIQ